MIRTDVWVEQESFDALLREKPGTEADIAEFLRDMGLNVMSEIDELLRTTVWKRHRRTTGKLPNHDHRMEEVADMFKLVLSIAQGLGYSQDELTKAFWRKSMVCRQRHSEEWVRSIDRPAVVVDIDNVLCDYTTGFCDWIANRAPLTAPFATEIKNRRAFFHKASQFGLTETEWQGFKHEFRSRGHKRCLPLMPFAKEFLDRVRAAKYQIILLTSRPIDRYPNIYGDTLTWLTDNHLPYDFVWWATNKGERLIESRALHNIKFVVDDDFTYINQFLRVGLETYHLQDARWPFHPREWEDPAVNSLIHVVTGLDQIPIPEMKEGEQYGI